MYNFKDDIAIPTHNYSTRLKLKSNVIIPKIETVFGQQLVLTILVYTVLLCK